MYRFDTGSGPAVVRSVEQVRPDTWHEVRVTRRLRAGTLALDSSPPVAAESPGTTRGLNIQTPFYFGGLDTDQFQPVAGRVGVAAEAGFRGCVAEIVLGGRTVHLVEDAVDSADIGDCGAESPCRGAPCQHGGQCTETAAGDSFTCACAPGYAGDTCARVETACEVERPCLNQATCTGNTTHYTCLCPWGYGGRHCNTSQLGLEFHPCLIIIFRTD